MIDLGLEKMMVIGAVALIVIGPEKLPRVARTVGALIGKAQRYVADVKAEVNRSIELDELKKMKQEVESAARDVESSIHSGVRDIQSELNQAQQGIAAAFDGTAAPALPDASVPIVYPEYRNPKKKWRIKQGATPQWYKARTGVRTRALSGAARVARYRPQKFN
ncbi:MAG TPA: Sec-independent protein translocase protein TatB [Ramlibacter sp.]